MNEFCRDEDEEGGSLLVLTVSAGEESRLDRYLAERCPELSRTRIKQLIMEGSVAIEGNICLAPARKVGVGEMVTITVPPIEEDTPVPENIPLDIIYEDDDLLVINKAAGMVVHPAPGHRTGTLVNALLYHCGDSLSGIGGVRRPGIVHRLDKDTSGLMLAAKNDRAHKALSAQLADRALARLYQAVVWGVPPLVRGRIEASVGRHPLQRQKMAAHVRQGRSAVTHYERKQIFGEAASLLLCRLETGRTHQIRVHMDHAGYPLIGDPVYKIQPTRGRALLKKSGYTPEAISKVMAFPRQALHASILQFVHPATEEELRFESVIPADIRELLDILKS